MKLYNTLTRKVEEFAPQDAERVKMYTCGPTVYSFAHIGNFTAYIYWDLLVRTIRLNGWKEDRVLNITDVGHLASDADDGEDKMEKGARRRFGARRGHVLRLHGSHSRGLWHQAAPGRGRASHPAH